MNSNLINAGIKHSDIKTANVCIDPNGCVSLIDFGSSKNWPPARISPRQRQRYKKPNWFFKKPNLNVYKLQLYHTLLGRISRSTSRKISRCITTSGQPDIAKLAKYGFSRTMLGPVTMASLSAIPYDESQDTGSDTILFKCNPWSILYMF